jgi:predicted metalloprotease with PDZ domain
MPKPQTHYFDIEILLKQPGAKAVSFAMPVWTPGAYSVQEFERNVQEFEAFGDRGRTLRWQKTDKSTWVVWPQKAQRLQVRYRVYAYHNRVSMSYLDAERARINPGSVLMYLKDFDFTLLLKIVPHPSWRQATTSMERIGKRRFSFGASCYDELVDSPVELGNYEARSFESWGKRHDVAMISSGGVDRAKFVADLKKIVDSTIPIFGEVPFERYAFLVEFTKDVLGGIEHQSSTCCQFSKLLIRPGWVYNRALSLFSHEFFHLWNVKRMRPSGLRRYDFAKENYTKSLWIAEGITTYYSDLILKRAGIYTVPEYLDSLVDQFDRYFAAPGRKVQTAEEASFDTWIKYSRIDENSANSSISYYVKGAILGWAIDMEIRRASDNSKSLDDVMQKVYAVGELNGAYTDEDFQEACESVAGKGLGGIFGGYVRGVEEVEFDRYLGYAGLRLKTHPQEETKVPKAFLGMELKPENGALLVSSVLSDSPAQLGGLYARDSIIAVDGLNTSPAEFEFVVRSRKPGSVLNLTISRDGSIRMLVVKLGRRPPFRFRIESIEGAGEDQKSLFKGWLGTPWEKIEYGELELPAKIQITDWLFYRPSFV